MDVVRDSRREARRAARSEWFGYFGRAGLAAQGVCFGIIAALAIGLAFGAGGEATDPQGALNALAHHTWSKILLLLLTAGFAGYALWRFAQALFDRGGMGSGPGGLLRRGIQFVQGLSYAVLTGGAAKTLAGSGGKEGSEKRAAAGIFDWPAGREIVGALAVVLLISALVTAYWGLSHRFEDSLATEEMGTETRRTVSAAGTLGLCALGLVLGVVAWFLLKAAIEYRPQDPVGLGGALAKLAHAPYGSWLLAATAAGLLVFALFDFLQARYHKV
jgi:hypothetical protein